MKHPRFSKSLAVLAHCLNVIIRIVYIASAVAAVGGLLFGYDIGVISGALLQLRDQFSLSPFQEVGVCYSS